MDAGAELSVFDRPSGSQLIAGGKLIILARPPQKETETDARWGQIYLPCLQCLDPRTHRISTLPTWDSTYHLTPEKPRDSEVKASLQ